MWHFGEPENGVLLVRIDRQGRPVNSFSLDTMAELHELARFVQGRDDIEAVVFQSGKPRNFIAGADLYEIRNNLNYEATLKMSQVGQAAFQAIADLSATTVALISGVVLGGGLEFAMACDYRIAADDPGTRLGLPEVDLGLMPGWGATVRTPQLIGYEAALGMLLTGNSLSPAEALDAGLVDQVVALDELAEAGLSAAARRAVSQPRDRDKDTDLDALLDQAEREQRQQTRDRYPAPMRIIRVLKNGLNATEEEKYQLEADGIAQLAADPVTSELIRLFFMKEASKKPPAHVKEAAKAFSLRSVGVVSDCEFGEEIASLFARQGIDTVLAALKDPESGSAAPSFEHLRRTRDVLDLADVSIAIECVVDDLEFERGLFQSMGTVVHPDAAIASTSASFLLREQTEGVPNPERLIGLRFFRPVESVSLLEIVQIEETGAEALGAAYSIARTLGRHTVLVQDSPGFVVNRVLLPYLIEAGYLLGELDDPSEVERIALDFGMSVGPLAATDAVGLQVAKEIGRRMTKELTEILSPSPVWRAVLDAEEGDGRLLDGEGRLSAPAVAAIERLAEERTEPLVTDPIQRMVYPMINAGAMCLAEGVVGSADAIDLALVLGGGFPAFRGGPMRYGETVGLSAVVEALKELSEGRPRLTPSDALLEYAESGAFPR